MKFQNTLIIELDLSPHIVNVLGREGIYCIADMIKRYKKDELIKMKGLGPKSKKELVSKLKQLGLGEPLEY